MTLHYSRIDENGTLIQVTTHPADNRLRIVVLPKTQGVHLTGEQTGAVYFMPWTEQLQFAEKLQDAKDEAEKNDEAAEGLAFLRAITGTDPEYVSRSQAMEYYQRAKKYFENQEHDALEGKN